MSDINSVVITGALGADPDLRFSGKGTPILSLRLAVNERYKEIGGSEWKERTTWISAVLFGKRGEALAQYLRKGSRVAVRGSLRVSSYDDRDGKKVYKTEINVDDISLFDRESGGREMGTGQQESPARQAPATVDYGGASDVEELPF